MASFDLEEPTDRESVASGDTPRSSFSSACSEGLGLLVWLGQLARDESTRRPSQIGIAESLDPPRSIGRFQLEALLGAGAYGAVFRALDTQLGRRVALKLAWPGVLMDPVASRRFVEEPKTVASLKHRGIVEVHDSGEIEMAAFIALELVDGPTLAQWLKEQEHVAPRLAAEIVRSVAEAIHFAHERGIVHRDLKPSNILLRPCMNGDGFGYEPVVTDFGLARRPRVSEMSILTGTQAIIGTDHYMSPEQAGGRKDDIGPASDIFSLGVILYELVAGCRPFEGDSSEQVRQRIQQDDPAPIRPWRTSVPKDLETIALKCLEKAPGHRFASARELADDLGRFLDNKPILARPVGVVQRGLKFAKRKPLVVSLVSLAVVSVLAIAGLSGAWIADRMNNAQIIAQAEEGAETSDGLQRQQQYVASIRRAAESLRLRGRRELLDDLEKCRSLAGGPVKCGLAWDWLWAQANNEEVTLQAHPKGVAVARFHPRGELMMSAGRDGKVIFWSVHDWKKLREIRYSNNSEVNAAEFSVDGSQMAVVGDDGRLVVYRTADGSPILDEKITPGRLFALAWIGSKPEVAVGGDGVTLWLVNTETGMRRTRQLEVSAEGRSSDPTHPDEIVALVHDSGSNAIAVFMSPATSWFVDTGSLELQNPSLAKHPWTDAACILEPGYLGVAEVRNLELWGTRDGALLSKTAVAGDVQSLCYSKAASALAVGFRDGTVQTFDFHSLLRGNEPASRRYPAHIGRAASVDISPDGAWLASGGWEGEVKLYRSPSMRESVDVSLPGMPFHVEFSPCGRWLAVSDLPRVGGAGRLTVFDVASGKRLWSTPCLPRPGETPDPPLFFELKLSTFDAKGDELLMIDLDWSIQTRDARTGRVKKNHSIAADSHISGIHASPDGASLLVHRGTAEPLILDRMSGKTIRNTAPMCLGAFRTVKGELWLDSDSSRNLFLRAASSGKVVLTLQGAADLVKAATVSADGRYLLAGSHDQVIYRWDLTKGGLPDKFVGHEAPVLDARFSPDGRTIISRGMHETIRFWDVATQSQLFIPCPDERVLSMDLSPKGDLLVCGVQHRTLGRYGLHVYRLGAKRESLPRTFEFLPPDAP